MSALAKYKPLGMSGATFELLNGFNIGTEIRDMLVKAGFDGILAEQTKELKEERERKEQEHNERENLITNLIKNNPELK